MSKVQSAPQGYSTEDALLHADPYISCLGRMAASDFAEKLCDLLNDELVRGTNPAILLITLARFQIQTHASLAAQLTRERGTKATAEHYITMIRETYVAHADQTRRNMEAAG